MTQTKLQLKTIGNINTPYIFQNIDTGEDMQVNIYRTKPFINELNVGDIGYGLIGEEENGTYWLNTWKKFEAQEPVQTINDYKDDTPKEATQEVVSLSSNGARVGMIINNAVSIAIAEMNAQGKTQVDLNRVAGVSRALNTMFKEEK